MPRATISDDDPRMTSYKARRAATLEARKIYAEVLAEWLPTVRSAAQTLEICEYVINLLPVQALLEFYEGRAAAEEVMGAAKQHDPVHFGYAAMALQTPTIKPGPTVTEVREVLRERRAPAVNIVNLTQEGDAHEQPGS